MTGEPTRQTLEKKKSEFQATLRKIDEDAKLHPERYNNPAAPVMRCRGTTYADTGSVNLTCY